MSCVNIKFPSTQSERLSCMCCRESRIENESPVLNMTDIKSEEKVASFMSFHVLGY